MALVSGSRLGPYDIVGTLGVGGMGEVYRARDARLQRDVAVKVLPDAFANDEDRRARFEREARTLASLNHPHIAMVYGLESAGEIHALIMELVEGETLAALIGRGRLPVPEALSIAEQIADALDAAHEQGIVHRDLKPANVKVRPDGTVKVLDFGLAKALVSGDGSAAGVANSPTFTAPARTQAGVILGTAAYMSPEQARGRPVDKRADIWAFGCVFYEMLTGRPVFDGESVTDILAGVVQGQPDWSALPPDLPPSIGALLRRALQKNPRERLRDIGDARLEIASTALGPRESVSPRPGAGTAHPRTSRVQRLAVALALVTVGALIALAVPQFISPRQAEDAVPAASVRSVVALPPGTTIAPSRGSSVALSPDGRQLVFIGLADKVSRLYVRPLERFESVPLAGTEQAANPFFSPDGRWVGFFADGKLKKVAVDGGAPVTLAEARVPRGEAWLKDDSILVTPLNNVGLLRLAALGGQAQPFTTLAAGEMSHRWPRAIAGGSAVLFTIWNDTGWEPSRIAVQRAGEATHRVLVEGGGYPRSVFDPTTGRSYLVYAREEGLLAAPFDADRLAVTGAPVSVVDDVSTNLSGGAHFDVAAGTLAFIPAAVGEGNRDLMWVSLDGQATLARRVPRMGLDFSLSPDGGRILRNNAVGTREVWIEDLNREASTRVTSSGENFAAVWSPDGEWIAFSRGAPIRNIYRRRLRPSALDERLTTSPRGQQVADISPDGNRIVYTEADPVTGVDLWVLDVPRAGTVGTADGAAAQGRPYLKTNFNESDPKVSPDGRWLAYQSNESGRFEIYVRAFPDAGPAHQVSTEGGLSPAWAPDGNLLYRATSGNLMAAVVTAGAQFTTATPRALFDASRYDNNFFVAPDGKRLLMMVATDSEQGSTTISLVTNFISELRQRVK